jgi:tetratricopeptide (TPR) repeat protein
MDGSVLKISHLSVRRVLLVCSAALAMSFLILPTTAHGQSPEYLDAYGRYLELRAQGRYEEALPFTQEAVRLGDREFGPNDVNTGYLVNELGWLYWQQGRYAEAEPLFERALAITEGVLGPDQPEVATSLNNLATLYRDQGRYVEAEPLLKRSLAILEVALGPLHPLVGQSLENYAVLLRDTGRDEEAAKMETRAKAIRAKHAGGHP